MSSHIRARKHLKAKQMATLVTLAFPAAVMAQQAVVLPDVKVEAKADVPYKADRSANSKYTQPLLDTPQTISVIKKEVLQEQGATTLAEALRNTPGITMQLGENGNTSAGDAFQMRGFAVQNSIFVDGIRDVGAITRDVYNLDQVEVVKGPSGGDIGRGATPGYINMMSKLPGLEDANFANASVNTVGGTRLTADMTKKIGDTTAVRINAMTQNSDVEDRDYVTNRGFAVAPSFATGLGTATRFYLYAQSIRQDNVPDGGIPTIGMPGYRYASDPADPVADAAGNSAPMVNRNNFYGGRGDYEKVKADMITAKLEADLASGMTLRNISRYGSTKMDRVLTSVADVTIVDPADRSTWTVDRRRQRVDQKNEILVNQTSLNSNFETGGIKHALSTGMELMYESQRTRSYDVIGNVPGDTEISPGSVYNPVVGNLPGMTPNGASIDGNTRTIALYAFDTLTLSEQWQLTGGVRLENYNTRTNQVSQVTARNLSTWEDILGVGNVAVGDLIPESAKQSGTLTSWKLGTVYKPAHNGSIYAAVANSYQPPGGSNFALASGSSSSSDSRSGLKAQESTNIEFGTKWDLLDKRLNLTAAIYRTENKNEVNYDALNDVYTQTGKRRVQGIELGMIGQITSAWNVSAGIAKMDSKILEGVTANSVNTGGAIRWTPDLTATLWTTYTLGDWSIGGGSRYVSEQKRVVATDVDLSQESMASIPSYTVWDAMVSYRLSKNATLRLNIYNIADKFYISTLNNGGNRAVLGLPRSAMLTAQFQF